MMRAFLPTVLIGLAVSAVAAHAEPTETSCHALIDQGLCVYAAPLDAQSDGAVASLSNVSGQVSLAGGAGYNPVDQQTGLNLGDRVVLLDGSQATLEAGGGFQTPLASPSIVDVSAIGNCACVQSEAEISVMAQVERDDNFNRVDLFVLGSLGVLGLAGVLADEDGDRDILLVDDDRPVSPD